MNARTIRILREERHLSQQSLADAAGIDQGCISRLEAGTRAAADYANRLMTALSNPLPEVQEPPRNLPELLAEAAAIREALTLVAHAIGRGEGDKPTLLSLTDRLLARQREISAHLDRRLREKGLA